MPSRTQTARFIDAHWECISRQPRPADAAAPVSTTWGGIEHTAVDFDAGWRASKEFSAAPQLEPGASPR
jgi:hypothetical protein